MTPRRWSRLSMLVDNRKVDPGIVGPVARRPDDRVDSTCFSSAKRTVRPETPIARGFMFDAVRRVISRGLDPISVSRSLAFVFPRRVLDGLVDQAPSSSATRRGHGPKRAAEAAADACRPRGCTLWVRRAPWRSGSPCCRLPRRERFPSVTSLGLSVAGAVCLQDLRRRARPPAWERSGVWKGPVATMTWSA